MLSLEHGCPWKLALLGSPVKDAQVWRAPCRLTQSKALWVYPAEFREAAVVSTWVLGVQSNPGQGQERRFFPHSGNPELVNTEGASRGVTQGGQNTRVGRDSSTSC